MLSESGVNARFYEPLPSILTSPVIPGCFAASFTCLGWLEKCGMNMSQQRKKAKRVRHQQNKPQSAGLQKFISALERGVISRREYVQLTGQAPPQKERKPIIFFGQNTVSR